VSEAGGPGRRYALDLMRLYTCVCTARFIFDCTFARRASDYLNADERYDEFSICERDSATLRVVE